MVYSITHQKDDNYLTVIHSGHMSLDELIESRKETAVLLREKNCHRIFYDLVNATHSLTTLDLYDFFDEVQAIFPIRTRIAFVVPAKGKLVEDGEFVEAILFNRGIDARMFFDREQAITWLLD